MLQPFFLPIDKRAGTRSTRCVEVVRRCLGKGVKVGHGGTLDSTASGLLIIMIGGATRLSNIVMQMPKVYRALVCLGRETTTCDYAGDTLLAGDCAHVNAADVDAVLPSFLGWRMQTPPDISAVHVDGRRAHELTRAGERPAILPRPVYIEHIRRTTPLSADGSFELLIRCGKGTYIRSVARDIGRALSCGAHLGALRRIQVGPFAVEGAFPMASEMSLTKDILLDALQPVSRLEDHMPCCLLEDGDALRLKRGMEISYARTVRHTFGHFCPWDLVMVRSDTLMGIASLESAGGEVTLKPEINIEIGLVRQNGD